MTTRDKVVAFQLSFCCAVLDRVRSEEKPKSARWNTLNNIEDKFQRTLDMYRAEAWSPEDLDKASELFNTMERKIAKLFPAPKRTRGGGTCPPN